tara:strand:- start:55 stop:684 length:630 start_codon:yes stop_codon:yes gene_type:complete
MSIKITELVWIKRRLLRLKKQVLKYEAFIKKEEKKDIDKQNEKKLDDAYDNLKIIHKEARVLIKDLREERKKSDELIEKVFGKDAHQSTSPRKKKGGTKRKRKTPQKKNKKKRRTRKKTPKLKTPKLKTHQDILNDLATLSNPFDNSFKKSLAEIRHPDEQSPLPHIPGNPDEIYKSMNDAYENRTKGGRKKKKKTKKRKKRKKKTKYN